MAAHKHPNQPRTSPTTTAPPVADWVPSCAASCPTWSATVAPSGSGTRITGMLATRARNHACSANSHAEVRTSQVRSDELLLASRVALGAGAATAGRTVTGRT